MHYREARRLQAARPDLLLLSFIPTSLEFVAALERAVIDGGSFRRLEHIAVRYKRMTAADADIFPVLSEFAPASIT
jgi:hypothetical protein